MKCICTVFAMLLVFTSVIAPTVANEADWMPDANLRTTVRSALDLDAGDTLTQADMENLTSLTAKNSEISNITGLESATNLETLDLRDNTISNINAISGLTGLETLRLKGNNIDNISALSGLTSLLLLNLRETGISSVSALSGLTNLEHLRLDGNSITDVQPLTSLVNLEKLWISGNSLTNAHLLSSLTNLTTIDITIPDPPDTTAPTMEISVPSETQTGAFDVTITFNESVSGFEESELDVSGDANASITSWSPNADNTVFTAEITPTTSGTVTLDIAVDVATDAASNGNTAATTQSVTVEVIPDAATWMPDANLRSVVRSALGLAANEAFSRDDLSTLTSLDAPQRQISNLTGLESATGLTTLVAWQNDITSVEPIKDLTTLTEIRIGSNDISDLQPLAGLTALTKLALQGNNISDVSALSGLVNLTWLRLARNPVTDFSPLSGLKANITDVDITIPDPDTTHPTVSITVPSSAQNGAFDATITFSETVSNFVQGDVSLSGTATASITVWDTTDNTVFTATITPTTSGTVTLDIAADVATDAANNNNTAATTQTVIVELKDETDPEVSISVPPGTQNGAFDVTITFTETVSGFDQADPLIFGTASASITAWNTTDDTVYTATITPTTSGNVILNIPVDVATDAAGNKNTAATEQKVVVELKDDTSPTASISVPSSVQNGAFDAAITFTETVLDFAQADLSLSGTASTSITDWNTTDNTVFTATITPTTSGTVILNVAANVATDAANNGNTAATTQTVEVTIDTVSIPNTALANLVRTTLSLAADATITTADMQRLTSLGSGAAKRLQINDLTGLEHATNLTSLTLPRNAVSDLSPLSNLTNLTTLALSRNSVSDLSPLASVTSLTTLHLKQNNIINLSHLVGLTNLTTLGLKNNNITDVTPLANLVSGGSTTLNTLELEHNNIPSTVANKTALQTLRDAGVSVDIILPDVANAPENTETGTLPHQTQLLANYPNPFNPETWIPYHLANPSDVQITIYDVRGNVVRRLELGHQQEGYYTNRSHAAYWDGTNAVGERVVSGVYFYQLRANEVSPLRKMVILK